MSIKPLDLQTLFVKMTQVGKDQAVIQKSVENQQAREANQLIKAENDRNSAVNKVEEGKPADSIKDKDEESSGQSHHNPGESKSESGQDEKPKYFTDPERGHNIDISG